jgi:riboflavin synthase
MFTGIVETIGIVKNIEIDKSNKIFTLESPFTNELKIDQSVSHNGVCLTVTDIEQNEYKVTAIEETLTKTNLNAWKIHDKINLERCMKADGRFDGHIVQGHVDTTAKCIDITNKNGSWLFTFQYQNENQTVEKGSITVNGVSLTVVNSKENEFSVAIIPYTFEHTNFHQLKTDDYVNIEFDIIGKYVAKMLNK